MFIIFVFLLNAFFFELDESINLIFSKLWYYLAIPLADKSTFVLGILL